MGAITVELRSKLRTTFSRLYQNDKRARTLLSGTFDNILNFDFSGSVADMWAGILSELEKHETIGKVVDAALADYPHDQSLKEISFEIREELSVERIKDEISKVMAILKDFGLGDCFHFVLDIVGKTEIVLKESVQNVHQEYTKAFTSKDLTRMKQARTVASERVGGLLERIEEVILVASGGENISVPEAVIGAKEGQETVAEEKTAPQKESKPKAIPKVTREMLDKMSDLLSPILTTKGPTRSRTMSKTSDAGRSADTPKVSPRVSKKTSQKKTQSPTQKERATDLTYYYHNLKASKSVGLVKLPTGGAATGILLKGGYLLCPNFLIGNAAAAKNATVTYGYDGMEITPAETYYLDTTEIWVYDGPKGTEDLYYCIVKIKDPHQTLQGWGNIDLALDAVPMKGDPIQIIHHPMAGRKAIGTATRILAIKDPLIIYDMDTMAGSAGGALLNQEYKLVGIHIMKYPSDGTLAPKGMKLEGGVLIQAIFTDLKERLGDVDYNKLPFTQF